MPYAIEIRPPAKRGLDGLPADERERAIRAIRKLAETPRPRGSEKIVGGNGERRIRVGVYRIIYDVNDATRTVTLLDVAHRREVYR